MRKKEKVLKRISEDKEICKRLKPESYYDAEQFVKDGFRYIKAIKEGRVINCIGSVSSSGMSRTMKFLECAKSKHHKNKYGLAMRSIPKGIAYRCCCVSGAD